jgi:peptidase E
MYFRIVAALACALIIAGCAKQPDAIAAADIGSQAYRGYSCAQLRDAQVRYGQALENLSASQRDAATGDAVAVFLIGLPLASMSGSDNETQIAVTKGHIQAIAREKSRKGCR